MTDLTVEQRLAELQAKGRTSAKKSKAVAAASVARLDTSGPTVHDRLAELRAQRTAGAFGDQRASRRVLEDVSYVPPVALADLAESAATATRWEALSQEWSVKWTPSRIAATGASVVSAAAVVVAMGPLLKSVAVSDQSIDAADLDAVAGAQVPAAPAVEVQVAPPPADGKVLGAMPLSDELVPLADTTPVPVDPAPTVDQSEPGAADTTTQVATTAATTASTTATTSGPSDTQPVSTTTAAPTTGAPTTAAPTTAAPTTAAPTTAAPTTVVPTTAPPTTPTTAPPTSQASGG